MVYYKINNWQDIEDYIEKVYNKKKPIKNSSLSRIIYWKYWREHQIWNYREWKDMKEKNFLIIKDFCDTRWIKLKFDTIYKKIN